MPVSDSAIEEAYLRFPSYGSQIEYMKKFMADEDGWDDERFLDEVAGVYLSNLKDWDMLSEEQSAAVDYLLSVPDEDLDAVKGDFLHIAKNLKETYKPEAVDLYSAEQQELSKDRYEIWMEDAEGFQEVAESGTRAVASMKSAFGTAAKHMIPGLRDYGQGLIDEAQETIRENTRLLKEFSDPDFDEKYGPGDSVWWTRNFTEGMESLPLTIVQMVPQIGNQVLQATAFAGKASGIGQGVGWAATAASILLNTLLEGGEWAEDVEQTMLSRGVSLDDIREATDASKWLTGLSSATVEFLGNDAILKGVIKNAKRPGILSKTAVATGEGVIIEPFEELTQDTIKDIAKTAVTLDERDKIMEDPLRTMTSSMFVGGFLGGGRGLITSTMEELRSGKVYPAIDLPRSARDFLDQLPDELKEETPAQEEQPIATLDDELESTAEVFTQPEDEPFADDEVPEAEAPNLAEMDDDDLRQELFAGNLPEAVEELSRRNNGGPVLTKKQADQLNKAYEGQDIKQTFEDFVVEPAPKEEPAKKPKNKNSYNVWGAKKLQSELDARGIEYAPVPEGKEDDKKYMDGARKAWRKLLVEDDAKSKEEPVAEEPTIDDPVGEIITIARDKHIQDMGMDDEFDVNEKADADIREALKDHPNADLTVSGPTQWEVTDPDGGPDGYSYKENQLGKTWTPTDDDSLVIHQSKTKEGLSDFMVSKREGNKSTVIGETGDFNTAVRVLEEAQKEAPAESEVAPVSENEVRIMAQKAKMSFDTEDLALQKKEAENLTYADETAKADLMAEFDERIEALETIPMVWGDADGVDKAEFLEDNGFEPTEAEEAFEDLPRDAKTRVMEEFSDFLQRKEEFAESDSEQGLDEDPEQGAVEIIEPVDDSGIDPTTAKNSGLSDGYNKKDRDPDFAESPVYEEAYLEGQAQFEEAANDLIDRYDDEVLTEEDLREYKAVLIRELAEEVASRANQSFTGDIDTAILYIIESQKPETSAAQEAEKVSLTYEKMIRKSGEVTKHSYRDGQGNLYYIGRMAGMAASDYAWHPMNADGSPIDLDGTEKLGVGEFPAFTTYTKADAVMELTKLIQEGKAENLIISEKKAEPKKAEPKEEKALFETRPKLPKAIADSDMPKTFQKVRPYQEEVVSKLSDKDLQKALYYYFWEGSKGINPGVEDFTSTAVKYEALERGMIKQDSDVRGGLQPAEAKAEADKQAELDKKRMGIEADSAYLRRALDLKTVKELREQYGKGTEADLKIAVATKAKIIEKIVQYHEEKALAELGQEPTAEVTEESPLENALTTLEPEEEKARRKELNKMPALKKGGLASTFGDAYDLPYTNDMNKARYIDLIIEFEKSRITPEEVVADEEAPTPEQATEASAAEQSGTTLPPKTYSGYDYVLNFSYFREDRPAERYIIEFFNNFASRNPDWAANPVIEIDGHSILMQGKRFEFRIPNSEYLRELPRGNRIFVDLNSFQGLENVKTKQGKEFKVAPVDLQGKPPGVNKDDELISNGVWTWTRKYAYRGALPISLRQGANVTVDAAMKEPGGIQKLAEMGGSPVVGENIVTATEVSPDKGKAPKTVKAVLLTDQDGKQLLMPKDRWTFYQKNWPDASLHLVGEGRKTVVLLRDTDGTPVGFSMPLESTYEFTGNIVADGLLTKDRQSAVKAAEKRAKDAEKGVQKFATPDEGAEVLRKQVPGPIPVFSGKGVKRAVYETLEKFGREGVNVVFVRDGYNGNKAKANKRTGEIRINLDQVSKEEVLELLAHEDFVHLALEGILGPQGYATLMGRVRAEMNREGSQMSKIAAEIRETYEVAGLPISELTLTEEVLAEWYEGEAAKDYDKRRTVFRRLWQKIKQFLDDAFGGEKSNDEIIADTMSRAFGKYLNSSVKLTEGADGVMRAQQKSATQIRGQLTEVRKRWPEVYNAVQRQLKKKTPEEEARIRANLRKHSGTGWAQVTIEGLALREMMEHYIAGETKQADKLMDSGIWRGPGDHPGTAATRKHLQAGNLLGAINAGSIIGGNRKAENAFSGSYANCDPSKACAAHCYAATGQYQGMSDAIFKSELIELAAERMPQDLANKIAGEYMTKSAWTQEDADGNPIHAALRLNDLGDLSPAMMKVIEFLNAKGIRLQIFSKRPELLRQVDDFNLRMLSVDMTNIEVARENPDLNLAVTITDEMPESVIEEINSRVAVYLPVHVNGKVYGRDRLMAKYPNMFGKMQKACCPIDAGGKLTPDRNYTASNIIFNRTNGAKGKWTCVSCDATGAHGCFHGERKTVLARAALETFRRKQNVTKEEIDRRVEGFRMNLELLVKLGEIDESRLEELYQRALDGRIDLWPERPRSSEERERIERREGGQQAPRGREESPEVEDDVRALDPGPRQNRIRMSSGLRRLHKEIDKGDMTFGEIQREVKKLLNEAEARVEEQSDRKDRILGFEMARTRLSEAVRQGELSEEGFQFAMWLFEQNPLLIDEVTFGVRKPTDDDQRDGVAGNYLAGAAGGSSYIRLVKGLMKEDTPVHEVLHHMERLMPEEFRRPIREAWLSSVLQARKDYSGEPAVLAYLDAVEAFWYKRNHDTKEALDKAYPKAKEIMGHDLAYSLRNPSEFWAVNGTNTLIERFNVSDSTVSRMKQWLKEAWEKLKAVWPWATSNAPVIRALDHIIKTSDGVTTRESKMLTKGVDFNALGDGSRGQRETELRWASQALEAAERELAEYNPLQRIGRGTPRSMVEARVKYLEDQVSLAQDRVQAAMESLDDFGGATIFDEMSDTKKDPTVDREGPGIGFAPDFQGQVRTVIPVLRDGGFSGHAEIMEAMLKALGAKNSQKRIGVGNIEIKTVHLIPGVEEDAEGAHYTQAFKNLIYLSSRNLRAAPNKRVAHAVVHETAHAASRGYLKDIEERYKDESRENIEREYDRLISEERATISALEIAPNSNRNDRMLKNARRVLPRLISSKDQGLRDYDLYWDLRQLMQTGELELGRRYGFTSVTEFVAEALSNVNLMREMAGVSTPETMQIADRWKGATLWKTFVNLLRRMFGIDLAQGSLLDAAIRTSAEAVRGERQNKSFFRSERREDEPSGRLFPEEETFDSSLQIPLSTGTPITARFIHNPTPAPVQGSEFGQDVEPAGRYMVLVPMDQTFVPEGSSTGVVEFSNPLVMEHRGYGPDGWKSRLSQRYGGRTGAKLSQAVLADGHDAVITFDEYGVNEVVDLSVLEGDQFSLDNRPATGEISLVEAQNLIAKHSFKYGKPANIILSEKDPPKPGVRASYRASDDTVTLYMKVMGPQEFADALAHEDLAHRMLPQILGEKRWQQIREMSRTDRSPAWKAARDYVTRAYANEDLTTDEFADEVIAKWVESQARKSKQPTFSFWGRIVTAFQNWWNKMFPDAPRTRRILEGYMKDALGNAREFRAFRSKSAPSTRDEMYSKQMADINEDGADDADIAGDSLDQDLKEKKGFFHAIDGILDRFKFYRQLRTDSKDISLPESWWYTAWWAAKKWDEVMEAVRIAQRRQRRRIKRTRAYLDEADQYLNLDKKGVGRKVVDAMLIAGDRLNIEFVSVQEAIDALKADQIYTKMKDADLQKLIDGLDADIFNAYKGVRKALDMVKQDMIKVAEKEMAALENLLRIEEENIARIKVVQAKIAKSKKEVTQAQMLDMLARLQDPKDKSVRWPVGDVGARRRKLMNEVKEIENYIGRERDVYDDQGNIIAKKGGLKAMKGYFPRHRDDGFHVIYTRPDGVVERRVFTGKYFALSRDKRDEAQAFMDDLLKKGYKPQPKRRDSESQAQYKARMEQDAKDGKKYVRMEEIERQNEDKFEMVNEHNEVQLLAEAMGPLANSDELLAKRMLKNIFFTRGWRSHMMKRQTQYEDDGTPVSVVVGYQEEDLGAVLSGYLAGYAGLRAKQDAAKEYRDLLMKFSGDKKKKGVAQYIKTIANDELRNQDGVDQVSNVIGAVNFLFYLGFRMSSAIVNTTQNFIIGAPVLAQRMREAEAYKGKIDIGRSETAAGAALAVGMKDAGAYLLYRRKKKKNPNAAIPKWGMENGKPTKEFLALEAEFEILDAQTLTDEDLRKLGGQATKRGKLIAMGGKMVELSGGMFTFTERANRAAAFLAYLRTMGPADKNSPLLDEVGENSLREKAGDFVTDTHYSYDKYNRPLLFKGSKGGRLARPLFASLLSYSWNFWQQLGTMDGRTFGGFAFAGTMIGGVPFQAAISSAVGMLTGLAGDEKDLEEELRRLMPKALADGWEFGVIPSAINAAGIPAPTLKHSLSMDWPPPAAIFATLVGAKSNDGPFQGLVMNALDAAAGRRPFADAAPQFVRTILQGYDEMTTGLTTRSGRPFAENGERVKLNAMEGIMRMAGFNPIERARYKGALYRQRLYNEGLGKARQRVTDLYISDPSDLNELRVEHFNEMIIRLKERYGEFVNTNIIGSTYIKTRSKAYNTTTGVRGT